MVYQDLAGPVKLRRKPFAAWKTKRGGVMSREHNSNYTGTVLCIEVKDNGFVLQKTGMIRAETIHKTFTDLVNQLAKHCGLSGVGETWIDGKVARDTAQDLKDWILSEEEEANVNRKESR